MKRTKNRGARTHTLGVDFDIRLTFTGKNSGNVVTQERWNCLSATLSLCVLFYVLLIYCSYLICCILPVLWCVFSFALPKRKRLPDFILSIWAKGERFWRFILLFFTVWNWLTVNYFWFFGFIKLFLCFIWIICLSIRLQRKILQWSSFPVFLLCYSALSQEALSGNRKPHTYTHRFWNYGQNNGLFLYSFVFTIKPLAQTKNKSVLHAAATLCFIILRSLWIFLCVFGFLVYIGGL